MATPSSPLGITLPSAGDLPSPLGGGGWPLVSIGIPTFNRAAGLEVAVQSALRQDYANLEVIISDNHSTDATPEVVRALCANDSRVTYCRHPKNLGPVANFDQARQLAGGRYFLWLADDDWLDPGYVSRCVHFLEQHPDYSLAGGRIQYYRGNQYCFDSAAIRLEATSGRERVLEYYRTVEDNGIYYGVMRLKQSLQVPLKNVLGSDWLFVASLAFLGKVGMVGEASIHRDYTWDQSSIERIGASAKLSRFETQYPYWAIALAAQRDIRESPVYENLGSFDRFWLAHQAFRMVCKHTRVRLHKVLFTWLKNWFNPPHEIGRIFG